jgi:hypothetical protein
LGPPRPPGPTAPPATTTTQGITEVH